MVVVSHIVLDTSQSNPKFLTRLCDIEDKVFHSSEVIATYKAEQGITAYLPEENALFEEVYEARKALFQAIATDKLLSREVSSSYGHPAKHDYIRLSGRPTNVRAEVIVKSQAKLTIDFYYTDVIAKKQRFVFKKSDEKWLLDEMKYGFPSDDKWFVDTLD